MFLGRRNRRASPVCGKEHRMSFADLFELGTVRSCIYCSVVWRDQSDYDPPLGSAARVIRRT